MAERLAESLLKARLVACINILPGARSLYRWNGKVERDEEVVIFLQSHGDRLSAIEEHLAEHHPYELPELIAVPIEDGSPPYLAWLDKELEINNDK